MTLRERRDRLIRQASDVEIVALTILHEQGFDKPGADEDRAFIASVIANRVRSGRATSARSACLARAQFSCWNHSETDANYRRLIERGERWVKTDALVGPIEEQVWWLGAGVVTGDMPDLVAGAEHYHTPGVAPSWSRGRAPVRETRWHLYFAGVA